MADDFVGSSQADAPRVTRKRLVASLGSFYGIFVLIFVAPTVLFSFGNNDPFLVKVGVSLYVLSILPASIAAFWFPRHSGIWLIGVSIIASLGLVYSQLHRFQPNGSYGLLIASICWWFFIGSIPGVLGVILILLAHPADS